MSKQLEELFEVFWKSYPRKVGKGACRKIWMRRKFDEETLDKMLETITWQKKTVQWQNKQFIPHPSTWLNQERFDDEMDTELMVGNTTKKQKDELMDIMAKKRLKMREGR